MATITRFKELSSQFHPIFQRDFERTSDKDSARFYTIAKGSAGEVRTQIYLSYALGYIKLEEKNELINEIETISKMLFQLISYKNQKLLRN